MLSFDQFKNSFFKDFYHLENDIFCVFDISEYEDEIITLLCNEARRHITQGFLFQTSGTTANKKFVLHDFDAVKTSCEAVNKYVQSQKMDRFLAPISIHHMGGFSVLARSYFAQAEKPLVLSKWSIVEFIKLIETESITVTSLVPSQIYDIVQSKIVCPESLKTVFVGGASLDEDLYWEAKKLKWPVLKTFGSSESCSQIFTDQQLLPHWNVTIDDDQRLQIKGPSLYKGYLFLEETSEIIPKLKNRVNYSVKFLETRINDRGYFRTEDLVEIKDNRLIGFKGRINDYVKINSTLVQLEVLRKRFYQFCTENEIDPEKTILSVKEDLKSGLHLVVYTELSLKNLDAKIKIWNSKCLSSESIRGIYSILNIPRTELGKVKYSSIS